MLNFHKSMPSTKWHILCVLLLTVLLNGCAAIHPIKGIPAQYLPTEYKAEMRSGKETIDLSLLRQPAPSHYLLDSGDVLGVYIEGVLGQFKDVPPVHFPQTQEVAPSLGYPIPIRENGTISLPLIGSIFARGLTLTQLEETIRRKYTTEKSILREGRDRILISLQKPRSYRVLVIRQENANDVVGSSAGNLNLGRSKRGTGRVINLPAYSNDVLHDGDVVFIESRDTEIFYTGGLLGGGQYTLPRDYDLDILGAISIAQAGGSGGSGKSTGGPSALNQDVTISASNAIILRQLPNGTQVPIKVDLYEAVRNPSQRILIQPGDYVILQYTKSEAIAAFVERHLLEGALFGLAASNLQSGGGGR